MRPRRAEILPNARLEQAEYVLAEIGIPLLFLHGSHDKTTPVSLATRAASQLDSAQLTVIDGAGT